MDATPAGDTEELVLGCTSNNSRRKEQDDAKNPSWHQGPCKSLLAFACRPLPCTRHIILGSSFRNLTRLVIAIAEYDDVDFGSGIGMHVNINALASTQYCSLRVLYRHKECCINTERT